MSNADRCSVGIWELPTLDEIEQGWGALRISVALRVAFFIA